MQEINNNYVLDIFNPMNAMTLKEILDDSEDLLDVISKAAQTLIPSVGYHIIHRKPVIFNKLIHNINKYPTTALMASFIFFANIAKDAVALSLERELNIRKIIIKTIKLSGSLTAVLEIYTKAVSFYCSEGIRPMNVPIPKIFQYMTLLASSTAHIRLIGKGITILKKSYNDPSLSNYEKIGLIFSAAICISSGSVGLIATFKTGKNLSLLNIIKPSLFDECNEHCRLGPDERIGFSFGE